MIKYINGNIFASTCEVYTNPVNCIGIMGGGLAREFKKLYPKMNDDYKAACKLNMLDVGKILMWSTKEDHPKYICLFPTKIHWKDPSRKQYIEDGLQTLITTVNKLKINSIAIPALGCGLGGLDFYFDVKPLMEYYLEPEKFLAEVYFPAEGTNNNV